MYESYFGLIEKPFSISPNPRYLYLSSQHEEALLHLKYGIEQGGCFVVLTGEVGTGKTTICHKLLEDLDEHANIALIINPIMNPRGLLLAISDELGIDHQGKDNGQELFKGIQDYLLNSFANGFRTIVIIDEAQQLSFKVLEQIRLLTNLETKEEKILQVVLIGQPELRSVLNNHYVRQLSQRITAYVEISPLSAMETQSYLKHRTRIAGVGKTLFDSKATKLIAKLTGGIPRKINLLADAALYASYAKNKKSVSRKEVVQASSEAHISSQLSQSSSVWMRSLFWFAIGVILTIMLMQLQNSVIATWMFNEKNETVHKDVVDQSHTKDDVNSHHWLPQNVNKKASPRESFNTDSEAIINRNSLHGIISSVDYLQYRGDNVAKKTLLLLWGESLNINFMTNDEFCILAETLFLKCQTLRGWSAVRQFNRATIAVMEHLGSEYTMVILNVGDSSAIVEISGQRYQMELNDLFSLNVVGFFSLWRPISIEKDSFSIGDFGKDVSQLKEQMESAIRVLSINQYGDEKVHSRTRLTGLEPITFDQKMLADAIVLQAKLGVTQDGIVEIKTQMAMNELLFGDYLPVLRQTF